MSKSPQRGNRYKTSGNPEAEFVDEAQTVLVNKRGVTDLIALQVIEEQALTRAYETLLSEVRADARITCILIRHVHREIFGDIYSWAGNWRSVWIGKPGMTWGAPDFIEKHMQEFERAVLLRHPAHSLGERDAFCRAIAEIQGEFLTIHPFREGNARTIKLVTNLLAAQTGRPLLVYDKTEQGAGLYIQAAKAAFRRDYGPLISIIQNSLTAAEQPPA